MCIRDSHGALFLLQRLGVLGDDEVVQARLVDLLGVPVLRLSLIHISEPTRLLSISYAVFCLKKKKSQLKQ